MSVTAQLIVEDHQPTTESKSTRAGTVNHSRKCACGHVLPWREWESAYYLHLAEVSLELGIKTGRMRAAADILEWTKRPRPEGGSTDFAIRAVMDEGASRAAHIAETGEVPQ